MRSFNLHEIEFELIKESTKSSTLHEIEFQKRRELLSSELKADRIPFCMK